MPPRACGVRRATSATAPGRHAADVFQPERHGGGARFEPARGRADTMSSAKDVGCFVVLSWRTISERHGPVSGSPVCPLGTRRRARMRAGRRARRRPRRTFPRRARCGSHVIRGEDARERVYRHALLGGARRARASTEGTRADDAQRPRLSSSSSSSSESSKGAWLTIASSTTFATASTRTPRRARRRRSHPATTRHATTAPSSSPR